MSDLSTSIMVKNFSTIMLTVPKMDVLQIVLHRIHVHNFLWAEINYTNQALGADGYCHGRGYTEGERIRDIVNTNRNEGWNYIPLTGEYWLDWDAASEDRTIYPNQANFLAGARPIGRARPVQTTNFCLERPLLELVLLADQQLRRLPPPPARYEMVDIDRQRAAIITAQSMLAADRDAALDQIADIVFHETRDQKRHQLDLMLDDVEQA